MHPELGRLGDLVVYSYGVLNLAPALRVFIRGLVAAAGTYVVRTQGVP